MPIGRELDLLCDAVRVVSRQKVTKTSGRGSIQRKLVIGFANERLMLLLEYYGLIGPALSDGSHDVLVTEVEVPGVLAELREFASKEAPHA
jgi:hypothetical protein